MTMVVLPVSLGAAAPRCWRGSSGSPASSTAFISRPMSSGGGSFGTLLGLGGPWLFAGVVRRPVSERS